MTVRGNEVIFHSALSFIRMFVSVRSILTASIILQYIVSCNVVLFLAVHAKWGAFGAWSACSAKCGAGEQTRSRSCIKTDPCGNDCVGSAGEKRACIVNPIGKQHLIWRHNFNVATSPTTIWRNHSQFRFVENKLVFWLTSMLKKTEIMQIFWYAAVRAVGSSTYITYFIFQ